ncbi:putative ribonuclease H-like domain-containing protein [Tanacetum coccineum]
MAFISSSNTNSGKSKVPTVQGFSTTSVQTTCTNVDAASLSYDTVCAYTATQPNGSQIKYKDITQIDDDDIEEMDIKCNLALLSMRADRFWKKTGKKITIQGSDVAGFDKSKKDPKVEEPAPKAMIAIDGIGWDWSYMVEEDEASKNHALMADEEIVPTEYALMANSSSSLDNEVEGRLVEFKEQEIKLCKRIRVLERDIGFRDNKIENLKSELEELKKEKESIDYKIENFENASKDLDSLLGSQKLDKDKKGLGFNEYSVVPPPLAQVYSPPKKDLSWMGLPEFVDDTVTNYNRPTPSIKVSKDVNVEQKSNSDSSFEKGGSFGNVASKPLIRFVKETGCPSVPKVINTETSNCEGILQDNIDDKGYWDSGCSRHMTENISYLSEFEPFNGGYVSFRHGGGKITGKDMDNGVEFRNRDWMNSVLGMALEWNFSNANEPSSKCRTPIPASTKIQFDQVELVLTSRVDIGVPLFFKIQNVWTLVDCPKGVRPIGTKWVLKNKRDERGIVIRNKARLVAQGHTQEEGIDYEEVFAPVARIEAIRLFLAYASYMGFTVYQMDVKSAFLYGTIDEEVYVMQPPGFQDSQFPNRVYKVEKAMYGLHQAPRAWYGEFLLVQVYVDDIIFGSSNPKLCREFEALMHDKFKMSAMGELNFFLGLQVLQKTDGIFLSQDQYVVDILKKFGLLDVKSMIGSLMYLTASRPDIMFAVCACARHHVTPKECHLHVVKRIFRKSTTGGCQFLGRRLISWQCKKQTIVATSTTEAEYVAAASGCGQVLWIQNQLLDYGYNFMNTKIYIDNNSAICIVKNPVYHSKTKHIEIRHHFIRDCYEKKLINVDHINTDDNVVDLLTKPFDVGRFQYLVKTELNIDFHQRVDFLEASHLRYGLTIHPTIYVSHIQQFWSTAMVETVDGETKIVAKIDGRQRTISESSIRRHLKLLDDEDTRTPRRLTKETIRISQSKVSSPRADETVPLTRGDRDGKDFPIVSSLDAGQARETIAKTSAMPHEASPRVTSLGGSEGSMQQKLQELMDLCTNLQNQHVLMEQRIQSQDLEITQLKNRVKTLEDAEKRREEFV